MRIVITGGTGFVGKRLAETLANQGHKIKIFSRRQGNSWHQNISIVKVNYDNVANLKRHLEGTEIVFHLAAVLFALDRETFENGNVVLTSNLAKAIQDISSIKKLIYLSSLAASGPAMYKKMPKREEDVCAPISDYGRTKLDAEQALIDNLDNKIPIVILRAPTVYGGAEAGVSKIATWVKRGIMVNTGDTDMFFSFVYVEDLVKALIIAAEKSEVNNSIFFISETKAYSWNYFITEMANAMGRPKPIMLNLPLWILKIVTSFYEIFARLTGTQPALNYDKIKEAYAKGHWVCSPRNWIKITGQQFTPLQIGLKKTYNKKEIK